MGLKENQKYLYKFNDRNKSCLAIIKWKKPSEQDKKLDGLFNEHPGFVIIKDGYSNPGEIFLADEGWFIIETECETIQELEDKFPEYFI